MFYLETKDVGWWYWVVIVLFLTCGMAADPLGYRLAIGMTTISAIHCWLWKGGVSAFPVQVRLCYLALLLLCWLEPIRWLYWVPRSAAGRQSCSDTVRWRALSRCFPGTEANPCPYRCWRRPSCPGRYGAA